MNDPFYDFFLFMLIFFKLIERNQLLDNQVQAY